ncbi:hypothetical protein MYMA111404_03045 [Mycoplasma marinum]|nr:hypothetical protein [Mycoplasma marinum]
MITQSTTKKYVSTYFLENQKVESGFFIFKNQLNNGVKFWC